MCGIAGIVSFGTEPESFSGLGQMLDALKRRGPDDQGDHRFDGARLGHRRLSIFDLSSAGHQPMVSRDGSFGIVFNGAIYNFRDLRSELEAAGIVFDSNTDTEVLLHGYKHWGIEKLVSRIEGMFAFGIWDQEARRLFLVRDRLGVKPLVWARNGSSIAFASTVRALREGGFAGGLRPDALIEYFEFGFVTDSNAVFEGIQKLRPGTILELGEGVEKETVYWTPPVAGSIDIGFEEAVQETERLFLEAVEKRLFADVPVGALLSGGIDSSLVCWAVAELGADLTAFTVGVPGDEWDESSVARKTARQLGIRHQILEMDGSGAPDIDRLSEAYGEPFACASALGLIDVSREVRKHATVLLTGDGGDDVFLGYPEHLHFLSAGKIAGLTPGFAKEILKRLTPLMPESGRIKRARSFLSYVAGGLGGVTRARDGIPFYQKHGLFGPALKDLEFPDRGIPLENGSELLDEFLAYDLRTRFTGEYLTKVDGGTMHHALEARSPFLDSKLWEFAAGLPYSIRLRGNEPKAILREIVRRRIGAELAAGKKQGFGVPVQRWLANEWFESFKQSMADSRSEALGFVDSKAVISKLEEARTAAWAPRQLWFVYVLESWLGREAL
ncbi:MAG: asparagine synthase (glutamine-hydrolyzing) [Pyrinomonadaceae bacterium]